MGNGTWQQYLAVPEQVLVSLIVPAKLLSNLESVRHDIEFWHCCRSQCQTVFQMKRQPSLWSIL